MSLHTQSSQATRSPQAACARAQQATMSYFL
jgi:hypothetical protein